MSYAIYTTEALVCGSRPNNTSDKSFLLFTKEAGMLWATARSVREERSRQRHALQDFSFVRVSLVKGKSGWRVGSVEAMQNPFFASTDRVRRTAVVHVVKLLRRFVHGESALPRLYRDIEECCALILAEPDVDARTVTTLLDFRALMELGYIAEHELLQAIIQANTIKEAYEYASVKDLALITKLTATASEASHL